MNFTTLPFAVFLIFLILLLAIVRHPLARKWIVLAASGIFYAWVDWRFVLLLAALILFDFFFARSLVKKEGQNPPSKPRLWVGILLNLLVLAFFKYFHFFGSGLSALLSSLGWDVGTLKVLLPLGMSFYIFQSISYLVDVFKGTAKPVSLLDYALFIAYFPRLVAGPILRAREFFPQLESGIRLDPVKMMEGVQLFLRGALQKLVIADNLAVMVNQVYQSPSLFSPLTTWLAVLAYAIQILCDFWGYTDMARGISRMLGIELPLNFDLPYTSQSITEFWSRWHISLSHWFRDYVFMPLRGSLLRRQPKYPEWVSLVVPSLVTMLLSGAWHGVGLNFILWGFLHGLFNVQEHLPGVKPARYSWRSWKAWLTSLLVFLLLALLWVLFRSPDWSTTLIIFQKLLFVEMPYQIEWVYSWALFLVPLVLLAGWLARRFKWSWPILPIQKPLVVAILLAELLIIFFFAHMETSPFIYMAF